MREAGAGPGATSWRGDRTAAGAAWAAQAYLVLPLVVAAALLRLVVAARFPPHVDEGNMLLGISTVAQNGWPMLPSGVLYLHGATISYLLAPLAKLGLLDYANLFPLRAVNALFGAVATWLAYRVGRDAMGREGPALLAAALVALDPLNVLWGGFIRMYALLQVLALVVAWSFIRYAANDEPDARGRRRWLVGMVVAFWLAIFTQVVAALLLPALAAAAIVLYGRRLLDRRRAMTVALAVCAVAPVAFLGLSTFVGYGSTTTRAQQGAALPGAQFLGDDAVDVSRLLNPQLSGLNDLFRYGPLSTLVPTIITLACGVLIGRVLLTAPTPGERMDRGAIGTLLLLFWTPVLAFAFVVAEQKSRYLLDVLPFASILLAAAMATLWTTTPASGRRWPARTGALLMLAVLALHVFGGLWTLGSWGTIQTQAGVVPALTYVRDHRQPGDLTIVGSTPEAYLMLGLDDPLMAMGGVLERPGSTAAGEKIDDWVGLKVIDSPEKLCAALADHPGAWFMLGDNRLDPGRPTTDIALGATRQVFASPDGYQVLQTLDPAEWNHAAAQRCARAIGA